MEAQKKSRLKNLQERIAKLKQLEAQEKRREREKERKARNHRLIRVGALVEMIVGESIDRGLLAGLLEKNKDWFSAQVLEDEAFSLKRRGDTLIAEREAENQKKELERQKEEEASIGNID